MTIEQTFNFWHEYLRKNWPQTAVKARRLFKKLVPELLICLMLFSPLIYPAAKADSSNVIVNGGFETGDGSSWTDISASSEQHHAGSYSGYIPQSTTAQYILASAVDGSLIDSITFWLYGYSSIGFGYTLYDDDSNDSWSIAAYSNEWTEYALEDITVDTDKTVVGFAWQANSASDFYIDDFSLYVEGVEPTPSPSPTPTPTPTPPPGSYNNIIINGGFENGTWYWQPGNIDVSSDYHYAGSYSFHDWEHYGSSEGQDAHQTLAYQVDTDTIASFSCWAFSPNNSGDWLQVIAQYSDYSITTITLTLTGDWTLYNFADQIPPNKIMTEVYIGVNQFRPDTMDFYVDNASLMVYGPEPTSTPPPSTTPTTAPVNTNWSIYWGWFIWAFIGIGFVVLAVVVVRASLKNAEGRNK